MAKFRHWQEEDIVFLKNNYAILPIEDIAEKLNRSIMAIIMYVSLKKLKLQRYKKPRNYTNYYNNLETIALDIQEALKEHSFFNMYHLQRAFYKKYIYHTEYSINKALKILIERDLVEYFENVNDKKRKNFRLKVK